MSQTKPISFLLLLTGQIFFQGIPILVNGTNCLLGYLIQKAFSLSSPSAPISNLILRPVDTFLRSLSNPPPFLHPLRSSLVQALQLVLTILFPRAYSQSQTTDLPCGMRAKLSFLNEHVYSIHEKLLIFYR